jgi:hypothetical protein
VDTGGKGRKRTDKTRLESIDRKFVDLYSSMVWTIRRGAEIEIMNTRKIYQARADVEV